MHADFDAVMFAINRVAASITIIFHIGRMHAIIDRCRLFCLIERAAYWRTAAVSRRSPAMMT